jgi:hypothetical protein
MAHDIASAGSAFKSATDSPLPTVRAPTIESPVHICINGELPISIALMTSIGAFALAASACFAGAAVYVSVSEQPARLQLDDRALLTQWKPSYQHGAAMQAPLALIGAILGLIAWRQTQAWQWLAGAVVLVSAWPYTLLVIRPTNNELLGTQLSEAGARTRALLEKWGRLHAGRSALGVLSMLLFLWAASS